MGKVFKSLTKLGIIGGVSYGAFKLKKQYEFLKETHNHVVAFNGKSLTYDDVFEGDSIAAIASGIDIDLTEAVFNEAYINLDLYGLGAGFRIVVPEGIKVEASGINKASGIQIDVPTVEEGKILNINYDMTGSGLLICSSLEDEVEEVEEVE